MKPRATRGDLHKDRVEEWDNVASYCAVFFILSSYTCPYSY